MLINYHRVTHHVATTAADILAVVGYKPRMSSRRDKIGGINPGAATAVGNGWERCTPQGISNANRGQVSTPREACSRNGFGSLWEEGPKRQHRTQGDNAAKHHPTDGGNASGTVKRQRPAQEGHRKGDEKQGGNTSRKFTTPWINSRHTRTTKGCSARGQRPTQTISVLPETLTMLICNFSLRGCLNLEQSRDPLLSGEPIKFLTSK